MDYIKLLWGFVFTLWLIPQADAGLLDSVTDKLTDSMFDPVKMEKKCRKGNSDLCWPAGNAYHSGDNVPADPIKATELFTLGCQGGDFESCKSLHGLARQFRDGEGVPLDSSRALELFLLACEGDPSRYIFSALSCASAGNMMYEGDGVAKNQARAVELYHQGCDNGSEYSCKKFGDELYSGEVVEQDFLEAALAYDKACNNQDPYVRACTSAGLIHLEVKGVESDAEKAAFYFEIGCNSLNNHGRSCFELGKLYHRGAINSDDPEIVVNLYRQACRISDSEWPEACLAVADLYKNGDGVERDPNMEREYYNYGCRLYLEEACRLRCEMACQEGQHWGCDSIETGNIPVGVSSCISDASQMVSPEMMEVLKNYSETNPEEVEKLMEVLQPESQQ